MSFICINVKHLKYPLLPVLSHVHESAALPRPNIQLLELNKDARVNISPYQKIAKLGEND